MSLTKVTYSMIQGQYVNVIDEGVLTTNTASQNFDILQNIIRNAGSHRKLIYWPHGTYQLDVFNPNNCVIIGDDVTLQFTRDPAKSVVMGQVTDCEISGFTFQSLEADLSNQRCTASKTTFNDCKFIGWRNPTGSNAWGIYFSDDQERCRLINCGFGDNTQSDIAIVDGAKNIVIENCYAIDPVGDPLNINCEPNTSADYNSVLIASCTIGLLQLLENGSGGTSNKSITVQNCDIADLKWDGASAVIQSCRVSSISGETQRFAGSLYATNSLGLSPNLIPDPYLMVNALNKAQALTNNQIWHMQTRSGTITGGGRTLGDENGLRYFRLNGAGENGVISYQLATNITATIGKSYCLAITGRRVTGTGGTHCDILDNVGGPSNVITCRFFRQSNLGNDEFDTQVVFFTATGPVNFNIQNSSSNSTASVDIKSISLHEVIFDGYNFDEMMNRYHTQFGPRAVVLAALPVTNPADQTGLQTGDMVTVNGDKTYGWDGTALQPMF